MKVVKEIEVDVPDLGVRIKEARENDPRSLRAIAKAAGMSATNWLRIEEENNKTLPLKTLKTIQNVLGVSFGVEIDGEVAQWANQNPNQPKRGTNIMNFEVPNPEEAHQTLQQLNQHLEGVVPLVFRCFELGLSIDDVVEFVTQDQPQYTSQTRAILGGFFEFLYDEIEDRNIQRLTKMIG
jgi:transcriptional regulator with XRE-family HTH domain